MLICITFDTYCGIVGLAINNFLAFIGLAILALVIIGYIKHLIFEREYRSWLREHEGTVFFCYTSRQNSREYVEQSVIPFLGPDVEVIYLEGKKPISRYKEKFVSVMLYRISHIGFPNIMIVKNGHVVDISLHKELYDTINQRKDDTSFLAILRQRVNTLRNG